MSKPKGTKIKILKGEKFIYIVLVLLLISTPIISVFTKATLSESNIRTERLRKKIIGQTNINESLTMQINELASLDKIQEVASVLGLTYNEGNVKVIRED